MQGQAVLLTGAFKQRMYKQEYEFKITGITVAENVKRTLTKQLQLEVDVRHVQQEMIQFFEKNLQTYPGNASVRFNVVEPKEAIKASLFSNGHGFEMNYEMIDYLEKTPEIEVQVVTA